LMGIKKKREKPPHIRSNPLAGKKGSHEGATRHAAAVLLKGGEKKKDNKKISFGFL